MPGMTGLTVVRIPHEATGTLCQTSSASSLSPYHLEQNGSPVLWMPGMTGLTVVRILH
jgi:CheY-like chemotaxis protein